MQCYRPRHAVGDVKFWSSLSSEWSPIFLLYDMTQLSFQVRGLMPGSVIITGGDGGNGSLAFIFLNLISHLLSDALQGFIFIQLFN